MNMSKGITYSPQETNICNKRNKNSQQIIRKAKLKNLL